MTQEQEKYQKIKVKREKNGDTEITGEISMEIINEYKKKTFARVQANFEMSGFRKGKVPEEIVRQSINEFHLLEDAAEAALEDMWPKIAAELKLEIVSPPKISITKLAANSPLEFKAITVTTPDVSLPNYKKIAQAILKTKTPVLIKDEEVEEVVTRVRKARADGDALPELTDELVKSIGKFENVADFKNKIKENLKQEKEIEERRKTREEIVERIVAEAKTHLSENLIKEKIKDAEEHRAAELIRMNITLEDYLKHTKKSVEELAKETKKSVEEDTKAKFVIQKIAEEEKITPTKEEVEHDTQLLLTQYPKANPKGVAHYVKTTLYDEKVLEFLEAQKEK